MTRVFNKLPVLWKRKIVFQTLLDKLGTSDKEKAVAAFNLGTYRIPKALMPGATEDNFGLTFRHIMDDDSNKGSIVEQVVDEIPSELTYAPKDTMCHDVARLVSML